MCVMTERAVSALPDNGALLVSPFTGMVPNRPASESRDGSAPRHLAPREPGRVGHSVTRGLAATMPVLLVGSMAITTLNLGPTPLAHRAKANSSDPNRAGTPTGATPTWLRPASAAQDAPTLASALATASAVPSVYTVRRGDSVSAIAERYGLSTPSVLALNGLSWKSLIFPGQVLRLSASKSPTTTPPKTTGPQTTAPATPSPAPAVATTPPATAPSLTTTHGTYTIVHGDTITAIARRFGVSVPAILAANHLVASSIIYTGRSLVIPGASKSTTPPSSQPAPTAPARTAPAQVGSATVPLSPSMAANARVIISVGRALGVPSYGIVIALATAAQESSLENLDYGDRDSVGLFQQRPSTGWGTVAQLTNPTYASELFYGGPKNPNKGKTRGLLDIPGWQEMSLTNAAQAVQISGAPTAYARWGTSARAWLAELT
jgi:LysM repeat protein